jgi:hypothetical protein
MKKYVLSLCMLCFAVLANAQAIKFYTFESDSAAYVPITGGTNATGGTTWDDPAFTAPLGFQFKFFGDSSTTLYADSLFNSAAIFTIKPFSLTSTSVNLLAALSADLRDASDSLNLSPITYKTEGTAPNRIFKLQYENAHFFGDTTGSNMNAQVWLHEGTNWIETRFGPATYNTSSFSLYDPEYGPGMVIIDRLSFLTGNVTKAYFVRDDPNTPNWDSMSGVIAGPEDFPGVDDHPSLGTIWRFKPVVEIVFPANVSNAKVNEVCTITNIGRVLHLNNKMQHTVQVAMYSADGKCVLQRKVEQGKQQYDASNLPAGVYKVVVNSTDAKGVYSLMLQ